MNGPKTGKEASGAFGQDGERSQSRASDVPRSVLFLDPYLLKMSIFSNTTTAHPGVRITILAPGFFPMWPAPSRFQRRLTPERTTYRGISCHPGCLAPESICTVPGCWNRLSLLNVYGAARIHRAAKIYISGGSTQGRPMPTGMPGPAFHAQRPPMEHMRHGMQSQMHGGCAPSLIHLELLNMAQSGATSDMASRHGTSTSPAVVPYACIYAPDAHATKAHSRLCLGLYAC